MEKVYIGMGGNLGDSLSILLNCLLEMRGFLKNLKYSSLWETEPQIVKDQPPFLNLVAGGDFDGQPEELIRNLWALENSAGRDRSKERSKGPRPLDLDILLFGEHQVASDILTIPHPAMTERAFVLVPLTELDQNIKSPVNGRTYADYLDSIDNQGFFCYKKQEDLSDLLQNMK